MKVEIVTTQGRVCRDMSDDPNWRLAEMQVTVGGILARQSLPDGRLAFIAEDAVRPRKEIPLASMRNTLGEEVLRLGEEQGLVGAVVICDAAC